ncbi:LysR family transcriptional regulator [Paeniroseomonas aquatica]|uniref:LysR family transcriptional regulator n=1 Tax=Paeniroseomonas aquatica TaxID=373043 RepID=A0ABT7ZZN1_9PROT|nr:LysR family transcriptional regulator [Paeniroseomonas aquatica]MDN3562924.1 LysR family transcriptional regulator [Paeniroseomonas aquatica]
MPRQPERWGANAGLLGAIDLRGLTLAIAVARSGSIRLAARGAGLTVSTVSRRLRALEDGLGVSLFERRPSGVKLTEAGERFLADATRLLDEVRDAASRARDAGSAATGRLVIGTYFSASTGRFRDSLVRFVRQRRRIEVRIREGGRHDLLTAVRRGNIDLALLLGPNEEPGLDRLALWQEAGMVALPADHALASRLMVLWSDLVAETFSISRRGSGPEAREKVEALLPSSHKARFVEQDVGREAMFNLVGAGLGVAVLAESASGASYPGVVFRPVGNETGPTMVEAAAYWDPKRDNPALRRFLAQLRATQGSRAG